MPNRRHDPASDRYPRQSAIYPNESHLTIQTSPDSWLGRALASRLRFLTSLRERLVSRNPGLSAGDQHHAEAGFALHHAGVAIGSFTFEVIGGSLRAPSSRRRSKSSEIFA